MGDPSGRRWAPASGDACVARAGKEAHGCWKVDEPETINESESQ